MRRGKEYKSYTSDFAKAYAASLKNSINDQLIHSADLIADFYYTAWIDAGKPSLFELIPDYNSTNENQLKADFKIYKHNQLVVTQKLIASKAAIKED